MERKGLSSNRLRVRRSLSRRDFLRLGGTGLAGMALLGTAACGDGGGDQGGGATNIVFSFGPDRSGTLQQLVDRFNQQHEGEIQATYQQMSRVTDEYFRTLVSEFQAGSPEIDVIGGDVIWGAEFAANGWIEDLSRRLYRDYELEVPDAFLKAPMNTVSYQNKLWGVPWFTDVGLLFYRKDLLDEAGLGQAPATWSGLKDIANQVTAETGTQHGFVFPGAEYEGGVVNGAEYIWNAGGSILTGNITVQSGGTPIIVTPNFITINDRDSVEGLRAERATITDNVAPKAVASYREKQCYEAFLKGDAVFMRNWPSAYGLAEEDFSNVSQGQIGIAALPVKEEGMQSWSCLGGWNMYINRASDKTDAAWEFIKFMTAPEQQKFRALEGSFLPTLRSLYDDREILDNAPVIDLGREIIAENARSRPVTPFYSTMSSRMANKFNASLKGETDPEQAVSELQTELENVVKQN
ncbi:MAG: ABC transporter substrate-binding protein [Rubrobacteraceae bacterium]